MIQELELVTSSMEFESMGGDNQGESIILVGPLMCRQTPSCFLQQSSNYRQDTSSLLAPQHGTQLEESSVAGIAHVSIKR
jgi:hypothetical protein